MKILVLAIHFEVTGARYIVDAFKRLNHDVKHVGRIERLKDAWGVDVPDKYIWKPDVLYNFVPEWKPDLIIVADTNSNWDKEYYKDYVDVPVVVWSNDNHVRNMRHVNADHYFLAHAHGKAQPVTHDDETWLPCATSAVDFPPSPIPFDQREYDVCCIGVMYPDRARRVQRLKDAGYKVFAATGLVYDEYRAAYQNARIALCSSVDGDLAQRFFEGASLGCLVFTDLLDDLVDDETNRKLGLSGFVSYNNDQELLDFAHSFLRDPQEIPKGIFGAKTLQEIVLTGYRTVGDERVKAGAFAAHTWDARAQVVVDWYEKEYGGKVTETYTTPKTYEVPWDDSNGVVKNWQPPKSLSDTDPETMKDAVAKLVEPRQRKAYLNLGCGTTHLPSAKPAGHEAVDDAVYAYPLWVNVDKVEGVGADKTFDLFTYPWPLEDSSYDGALLAHIVEHVGHEIKINPEFEGGERAKDLAKLQDGWYAFFSELYRVLTPGALVHIVSPYGWSDGGITDPSHTRYLTLNTFTHSMTPEISDGSTFKYNNGSINFVIDGQPVYRFTPYGKLMQERTGFDLNVLLGLYLNMVYDFYIKLRVVK